MNFRQKITGEPLYGVWEKFHMMLAKWPNHEIQRKILFKILYWALGPLNQSVVYIAAKSHFLNLYFHVTTKLLREVTKYNWEYHTHVIYITNSFPNTTMTIRDKTKQKEDKEKIIEKNQAQLELLTKYVIDGTVNTTSPMPQKYHYKDEGAS